MRVLGTRESAQDRLGLGSCCRVVGHLAIGGDRDGRKLDVLQGLLYVGGRFGARSSAVNIVVLSTSIQFGVDADYDLARLDVHALGPASARNNPTCAPQVGNLRLPLDGVAHVDATA